MTAVSIEDCFPSEVGNSGDYNRLQMRRALQARGDPAAKAAHDTACELLRVLVVDDCHAAADTMSMLVATWGHEVRCAYNGTSALALAAAFQPDVLLLDIAMPTMSGLGLARQVRQHEILSDCFMIAVTGYTDEWSRRQSQEAGIDLFLIKPVDPSILQTLLMLEAEYVSRSRQSIPMHEVFSIAAQQWEYPNSQMPTRLPYHVLQETVVS